LAATSESVAGLSAADCPATRTIVIEVPGENLRADLRRACWPDFGFWLYRSRRLYFAIRCGPTARNLTNHAHNDQLSIELAVDGIDWLVDPGSYIYAPPRERRNTWRSVWAHSAPRGEEEPASLALGNFCLGREGDGRVLRFADHEFIGEHHGFGRPLRRMIAITANMITVCDFDPCGAASPGIVRCADPTSARAAFGMDVPFSPGYGKLLRRSPS
jgi:hypothetical protein